MRGRRPPKTPMQRATLGAWGGGAARGSCEGAEKARADSPGGKSGCNRLQVGHEKTVRGAHVLLREKAISAVSSKQGENSERTQQCHGCRKGAVKGRCQRVASIVTIAHQNRGGGLGAPKEASCGEADSDLGKARPGKSRLSEAHAAEPRTLQAPCRKPTEGKWRGGGTVRFSQRLRTIAGAGGSLGTSLDKRSTGTAQPQSERVSWRLFTPSQNGRRPRVNLASIECNRSARTRLDCTCGLQLRLFDCDTGDFLGGEKSLGVGVCEAMQL